jgi:hypothetical protein
VGLEVARRGLADLRAFVSKTRRLAVGAALEMPQRETNPMTNLSRSFALTILLAGLAACSEKDGLWENTSTAEYEVYCTIEFCDAIETSAEPECRCPCEDDGDWGDDCTGEGCDDGGGGGDDGGGGGGDDCTGDDCPDGGGDGCTLTQGYWKNHNEFRTQRSQRLDWPAPLDEGQLLCNQKWLDILHTVPRGEAWYILAHQYIAASLNAASGASTTDLGTALADSKAILTANCGGITAERQTAIDLSYKLDSYNNGLIGPGHCD